MSVLVDQHLVRLGDEGNRRQGRRDGADDFGGGHANLRAMRAAIIAFIVLAGSAAAGPARAAQLGIYAGISYAMVEKDSDRSVFENEVAAIYNAFGFVPESTTVSFDTEDSAYGFVVGWRLTEHIAVEGGYLDLGEVKYRDRSTGLFDNTPPPENWGQNLETSTSGIALSALGILPLSY